MAAIIRVVLVACLCSWVTTVDGIYVPGSVNNQTHDSRIYTGKDLQSNTSFVSRDIQFSFPGILPMVIRLDVMIMGVSVTKPNPADCPLEADAMKCGASMLLERWGTGYDVTPRPRPRTPGSGDRRPGSQVGDTYEDIYGHDIHRTCTIYEHYKLCLQNRKTDFNRCMSPAHTTVHTLYEYICQPNVTQDLIKSGECISGVTTEQILSHYGEACRADYAGFGWRMLQAINGFNMEFYTYKMYANCYVPGVWYYCGEAAGRLYRGLVAHLERATMRAVGVVVPVWAPTSFKQTYRQFAEYYHTEAGRKAVTGDIIESEHIYRETSRELGSCSASGLISRMQYCTVKDNTKLDKPPPDMEFACGPYGLLTQFINCYQPATEHCQLTGDHNVTDVITKVCSAFRSARTSDYCLPSLAVANSYLRACDMDLLLFVDYISYLNMESEYMLFVNHKTLPVTLGSQRNCLHHEKITGNEDISRGCGSVYMKNILAGLEALAGWPRSMAELWDMSRQERCSLTHTCDTL